MLRGNGSTGPQVSPQILYRGLYVRIARKLGLDPSYISRVARGDRRSPQVENALRQELEKISQKLGDRAGGDGSGVRRRASAAERLDLLIGQNRNRIRREWLQHCRANPDLRRVKIANRKRTAPILPVIEETRRAMKLNLKLMSEAAMRAAQRHGRLRQAEGFTAMDLVEEYNLVRRCVFSLARERCHRMDQRLLIQDLTQFGEALDLQTQRALRGYLATA